MPSFSDLISGRFGGGVNDPNRRTSNNGSGRSGTVSRSVTRAAPKVGGGDSYSAPTNVPSPAARVRNAFRASKGSSSADKNLGRATRAAAKRTTSPGVSNVPVSQRITGAFEDVKGGFPKYTSLLQPRAEASAARVAASSRSNIDDKTVLSGASRSVPRSKPSVDNVTRPGRGPSTPQAKPSTPSSRVAGAFSTLGPRPQPKPAPRATPQAKPRPTSYRRTVKQPLDDGIVDVGFGRNIPRRKPGIF